MDFATGLSIGLILGGIGGGIASLYIFAESFGVSESDPEQEIMQEPIRTEETVEPENISPNEAQKYSGTKRRRKKGITGRSKKKRRRGG